MKKDILNIETVHQCNCCLGYKTLHPLVCVIDLSKANLEQRTLRFDFYTILLLENQTEESFYGRKYYDYSNASLIFLTPGESIKIDKNKILPPKGWLLAFHPDLLYRTSLGENIKNYTFFLLPFERSVTPFPARKGKSDRMFVQHRGRVATRHRLP